MVLCDVRYWRIVWCYAMCGTGTAYGAAMCGTGTSYGATRCAVLAQRMVLRDVRYWHSVWCYAMCGTDTSCISLREPIGASGGGREREGKLILYPPTACCALVRY
eukprot:2049305-Rhodomonas_salina.1